MTISDGPWDVVAASTVGKAHQRARRGSQDAWAVRRGPDFAVGVVCDGCSAGSSSEIGAGLGARFVAADLARRLKAGVQVDDLAAATVSALVAMVGRTASSCACDDDDVTDVLASCFLFTVQVAVIGPEHYCVFGIGDGLVRVNGLSVPVPAAEDGAPDCPTYLLVEGQREHARLRIHARGRSADLRCVGVGTDGALELESLSSTLLAGGEPFGELSVFEHDERFVMNQSLATKRINSLEGRAPQDDCSFIVLRRRGPVIGTALGELDGGGMSCT